MNKVFLALLTLFMACAPMTSRQKEALWGNHPPIIKEILATEVVRPGSGWKLYINAKDEDKDLACLYLFLYPLTGGPYFAKFIKIPSRFAQNLKGYFILTVSDRWVWGTKIKVEIFLKDKAGHKSNPVYFLAKVVYKRPKILRVPAELKHYLGMIDITFHTPFFDEGGYFKGIDWVWGN